MSVLLRNWRWILATLVVAGAVHVISVYCLPQLIMARTMMGIERLNGVNHMGFSARPTSDSRAVVRPSPDLLYATCVLDLSKGPVRITVSGIPDTYWSVSLFDDKTNNFYVVNDRQAKNGKVDFFVSIPMPFDPPAADMHVPLILSPSAHALALLRVLIDDEKKLPAIDKARRNARCEAYLD